MTETLASQQTVLPTFQKKLSDYGLMLERTGLKIVQVNIGKLCNLSCVHCHVEAGPDKTRENMDAKTAERLVALLGNSPGVETVDITGGAPELNPHFRALVDESRRLGKHVIDRCNLTVLLLQGQEDLAGFLASHQVEVVASLPCYTRELVDKQRGKGVFDDSVKALLLLNSLGYGKPGSGLVLNLVYNPVGAHLPPSQEELEPDYRSELTELFGVTFNKLYTITNMAITRYARYLYKTGKLHEYQILLANAFNPATVENLMCRSLVSVSWEGKLFDCDFNQQMNMPLAAGPRTIWDLEKFDAISYGPIATASHCFGCTAGHGSSCGGALQ